MGVTELVFELKLAATYSPMIVHFVDTMMLVSTSIEWL